MTTTPENSSAQWTWWRYLILSLCLTGLAITGYLGVTAVLGAKVIGCGEGSSCSQVLSSKWSSIGGVLPVSGLAAGAYLALLMSCLFIGPATETPVRKLAWRAMLMLAGCIVGSAIWFTILQHWVIKDWCRWCMTAHSNGLILSALIFWKASSCRDENEPEKKRLVGFVPSSALMMFGLFLSGAMAAAQIVYTPPSVYVSGVVHGDPATKPGDGKPSKVVGLDGVPLIGSRNPQYVVNLFFDYGCSHCQKVHGMLEEIAGRYQGKLAFMICPAPLNTRCNPHVGRDREEFRESCDLAKTTLAVWFAKPEAFKAFDDWMFTPEPDRLWRPRSLEAATAKAIEILGKPAFDAAIADPRIAQYMQTAIEIYGTTVDQTGNSIPRFLYEKRWTAPMPNDADELLKILQDSLGLPKP